MPLRKLKPNSPGQRGVVIQTTDDITTRKPKKSLTKGMKRGSGRDNKGRISVRHRGGSHKRRYREIDFKRNKHDIPGEIFSIEYDPNRSARIALVKYKDGEWRYIIAPLGLQVGSQIISGESAEIRVGNALPLKSIPTGAEVHNIEMKPGAGGQLVRSAGGSAQVLAKEGNQTLIRMPSGDVRRVNSDCMATIGQIGATDNKNTKHGKAGRRRNMGWRPSVRGVVMSPRDHPHGGGEGKSPIGMPSPKTPWGKPALGYRTRRNKSTTKNIVRRRYQK